MRYVNSTNGSILPFLRFKKQESVSWTNRFLFLFFYKRPSNGCLYIYNSISEAQIICRQLLCIQKTKLGKKNPKKNLNFFLIFWKSSRTLIQHRTSPSLTVITRSAAAYSYSQTLSVSYRSHSSRYSSSSSKAPFSSSSWLSWLSSSWSASATCMRLAAFLPWDTPTHAPHILTHRQAPHMVPDHFLSAGCA